MARKIGSRVLMELVEPRRMLSATPSPHVQVTQTTNVGFSAFFEATLPDGNTCDVTFVCGQDWVKTASGTKSEIQAFLNVHVYNTTQFIDWFDSTTDSTQPTKVSFTFDPVLHTLRAVGDLSLDDGPSGQDIPAHFDITCHNQGGASAQNILTVDNSVPGQTEISAIQGVDWNAQATGTIKFGVVQGTGQHGSIFYQNSGNLIPQPSFSFGTQIDYNKETDVSITPALPIPSGTWSRSVSASSVDLDPGSNSSLASQVFCGTPLKASDFLNFAAGH